MPGQELEKRMTALAVMIAAVGIFALLEVIMKGDDCSGKRPDWADPVKYWQTNEIKRRSMKP